MIPLLVLQTHVSNLPGTGSHFVPVGSASEGRIACAMNSSDSVQNMVESTSNALASLKSVYASGSTPFQGNVGIT